MAACAMTTSHLPPSSSSTPSSTSTQSSLSAGASRPRSCSLASPTSSAGVTAPGASSSSSVSPSCAMEHRAAASASAAADVEENSVGSPGTPPSTTVPPPACVRSMSVSRSGRYKSKTRQRVRLSSVDVNAVTAGAEEPDHAAFAAAQNSFFSLYSKSGGNGKTAGNGAVDRDIITASTAKQNSALTSQTMGVKNTAPVKHGATTGNVLMSDEDAPPLEIAFESTDL